MENQQEFRNSGGHWYYLYKGLEYSQVIYMYIHL